MLRHLMLSRTRRVTALCGALLATAFAPSAHAVATYSALTDLTINAVADVPGAVSVQAKAENYLLDAQANGNAFAVASQSGANNTFVDLLDVSLRVVADVSGSAGGAPFGPGDAASDSLNNVVFSIFNAVGQTDVSVTLTFTWKQEVSAATQFPGEVANARSELVISQAMGPTLVDSVIFVSALNGLALDDDAEGSFSVTYVLGPQAEVRVVLGSGYVDSDGDATGIPEPASLSLLLAGLAGLGFTRGRRLAT